MSARTYRAIIIDDEAWIRDGLSKHIGWERLGIELVQIFEDGQDALSFLLENPVHIVLSDIRMPNMTGLELVATVREEAKQRKHLSDMKVIFLSGFGDFKYAQEALRLGAVDYLLKPTDVEEIEEALAKAAALVGNTNDITNNRTSTSMSSTNTNGTSSLEIADLIEEPASYLIKKALGMMAATFTEDIHLSEIADELCVTPNYLSRLFRQETGKSFSDLLSDLRMEKATELLRTSTLKIYQIGDAVGYPNARYFSEWFQKQTGMSPGDYRKQHVL
ncbi:response regulator transcription factor [Paenibacillus hexagrammi]|uniref:Response regulator n=1 Tax=Paenibacillus hexagrammi TaxID=2908839 RepID=A0ABY3SLP2_9BACL|nr:helix-turn-helix domain-containing protein [Paenibacillus sp. YPD9-1]UJF34871.1 response regulator [Paenibacillus sp. YPD9-1]